MKRKINWFYAIGEIIIVIIGITIAFALNSWNEDRQNDQVKKQYLVNMQNDIDEELLHLDELKEDFNQKIKMIDDVLGQMRTGNVNQQTAMTLFGIAKHMPFKPQKTTYHTLINSGDFKLINNFTLKKEIEIHYGQHDDLDIDFKRISNIHEKYFGDFFIHEIDYDKFGQGDVSFLKKKVLKNILQSLKGAYTFALQGIDRGAESNQRLRGIIKVK